MPTSTKTNGLKGTSNHIFSHLPRRSLTKQVLKRFATVLKRKPDTSCSGCSQEEGECSSKKEPQPSSCSCHGQISSHNDSQNGGPPVLSKRVSFCATVNVALTIGRHDISHEEHEQTWYQEEEFLDIADDCYALVQKATKGRKPKNGCPRGLERMTRAGMKQAMDNRKAAVNLVLDEQDRQYMEGVFDDEYTAFLYHSISSSCHLWAAVVGLHDEKEAQLEYHDSDFQSWLEKPVLLSSSPQKSSANPIPRRSAFLRSITGARAA